jgi:hypothetical protein
VRRQHGRRHVATCSSLHPLPWPFSIPYSLRTRVIAGCGNGGSPGGAHLIPPPPVPAFRGRRTDVGGGGCSRTGSEHSLLRVAFRIWICGESGLKPFIFSECDGQGISATECEFTFAALPLHRSSGSSATQRRDAIGPGHVASPRMRVNGATRREWPFSIQLGQCRHRPARSAMGHQCPKPSNETSDHLRIELPRSEAGAGSSGIGASR